MSCSCLLSSICLRFLSVRESGVVPSVPTPLLPLPPSGVALLFSLCFPFPQEAVFPGSAVGTAVFFVDWVVSATGIGIHRHKHARARVAPSLPPLPKGAEVERETVARHRRTHRGTQTRTRPLPRCRLPCFATVALAHSLLLRCVRRKSASRP